MSQSYREDCNDAKAVRRGIVEPRPLRAAKKRTKGQVVVEYRYPSLPMARARSWSKFGAYPDLATAQQVIANKTRSGSSGAEFRIRPEEPKHGTA